MSRISNEIVWAVVASVICGALVASLLGGSPLPLLVIVAAVAVGIAHTAVRGRRERHRHLPRRSRAGRRERTRPAADPEPPRDEAGGAVRAPISARAGVDPASRRIGARAQSLGAQPPPQSPDQPS